MAADRKHEWKYVDDEYNGLAGGGNYEVYRCETCGKKKYVQLSDG